VRLPNTLSFATQPLAPLTVRGHCDIFVGFTETFGMGCKTNKTLPPSPLASWLTSISCAFDKNFRNWCQKHKHNRVRQNNSTGCVRKPHQRQRLMVVLCRAPSRYPFRPKCQDISVEPFAYGRSCELTVTSTSTKGGFAPPRPPALGVCHPQTPA